MKNKSDIFYIIFLNHPVQTLQIIRKICQKFGTEMPVLRLRFIIVKDIKNSSKIKLILARIMELEKSSLDLVSTLQKIPGIVVTNQIEILK